MKTPVGSADRPSRPPVAAMPSSADMSRLVKGTRCWIVLAPSAVNERRSSSTMIRSPGRERHVVARVVVEVLQPDAAGAAAALDLDLRDVGHHHRRRRPGEHRRQPPGRRLDRVDAGRLHPAHDADRRAVAGDADHLDLRVGGLVHQPLGDDLAQLVGRPAGGLDPADVGHEDRARLVDLHRLDRGGALADAGEQPGVDVLPDPHRQRVAGADRVGGDLAGADEVRAEAERLDRARGRRDRRGDGDDVHVVLRQVAAPA